MLDLDKPCLNFEAFEFFKVLNARLRVVSILSADNDDIRFQPALAIFSTKNSYGLVFDRSSFWNFFLQVLSEIKCYLCKLTELTQYSLVGTAQSNQLFCIKYNWTLVYLNWKLYLFHFLTVSDCIQLVLIKWCWTAWYRRLEWRRSLWSCWSRECLGWIRRLTARRLRYQMYHRRGRG